MCMCMCMCVEVDVDVDVMCPPTTGQRDQIPSQLDLANPSVRRIGGRIQIGTPKSTDMNRDAY